MKKNKFVLCFRLPDVQREAESDIPDSLVDHISTPNTVAKKRSQNKLFLRFQPRATAIGIVSNGPDHISTGTTVAENRNPKIYVLKSPVPSVDMLKSPVKGIPTRTKGRTKSFSGFAKVFMFEISSKKKALQVGEELSSSDSSKINAFSDTSKSSPSSSRSSLSNSSPNPEISSDINKGFSAESCSLTQKKSTSPTSGSSSPNPSLAPKNSFRKTKGFPSESLSSNRKKLSSLSTSFSSPNPSPKPKISSQQNKGFRTESRSLNQKKQSTKKSRRQVENTVIYSRRRKSQEGMLLILSSFMITVFYGRLCAVLLTSMFLYLMCCLRNGQQVVPVENVVVATPERDSVARDYKKRVIMEGFLQRNNYQRRGH